MCAVISLRCVCPLTQATSRGWVSRYAVTSSPSTRGFTSPPVATNGLVIEALVWWLNTITALPVADSIVLFSQANCAWSSEPSA